MLKKPLLPQDRMAENVIEKMHQEIGSALSLQYFEDDYRNILSPIFTKKTACERSSALVSASSQPTQVGVINIFEVDLYCLHGGLPMGEGRAGDVVVFHNHTTQEYMVFCGMPDKMNRLVGFRLRAALDPSLAAQNLMAPWNKHFMKTYHECANPNRLVYVHTQPRCIETYSRLMAPVDQIRVDYLVTNIINPTFAARYGVAQTLRLKNMAQRCDDSATYPQAVRSIGRLFRVLGHRAASLHR
ncbi:MAG: hypothetical protein PHD48_09290 [Alphaproteobacteria bacterium]|nr:hypothetical protein [Alphaproteobacteria bacterium]